MLSLSKSKTPYQALSPSDAELEAVPFNESDTLKGIHGRHEKPSLMRVPKAIHLFIIGTELLVAGVLAFAFFILSQKHLQSAKHVSLDGLRELGGYNTTMKFHNNSELLRDSDMANDYWRNLLGGGGVISVNTEWALAQGLQQSATSPTDPNQSIYQVDVFHALHCLVSFDAVAFTVKRG